MERYDESSRACCDMKKKGCGVKAPGKKKAPMDADDNLYQPPPQPKGTK